MTANKTSDKISIAILFGGVSSEHEISRLSASSVIKNLSDDKYEKHLIGITKTGRWFLYTGDVNKIADGSWEDDENNALAFISPDKSTKGIVAETENGHETISVDVVFPVLHGKNGEDGTIQGLLQIAAIPFVGCDAFSSAVCMDKAVTHSLLSNSNIEMTNYLWFYRNRYEADAENIINKIEARLTFPVFVKPANAGSSVGVSKVDNKDQLDAAIKKAGLEDEKILVEDGVIGQEVECAVLGNRADAKASVIGEIGATADFYDYDDKYVSGTAELHIPARISDDVATEIQKIAVRAFRHLGCSGLSRVDFFITEDNKILLNEINTMPGFTDISMYPKLWMHMGLSYSELLDKLIELAFEKAND